MACASGSKPRVCCSSLTWSAVASLRSSCSWAVEDNLTSDTSNRRAPSEALDAKHPVRLAEAQSVRRAGCDHRVALGAASEDELKIQRSDFGREGDIPLCLPKLMGEPCFALCGFDACDFRHFFQRCVGLSCSFCLSGSCPFHQLDLLAILA